MKVREIATSVITFAVLAIAPCAASAQESVIYSFGQFADGRGPMSAPLFDAAGNMYGSAPSGGMPGEPYFNTNGMIWELTPAAGGTWTETVLYNFGTVAGDGSGPNGSLIFDAAGNLYGTATSGGANGLGIVFELSPGASAGGAWTEKVLYNFQGGTTDGANPQRVTLVRDGKGNLYGTTEYGGAYGSNSSGGTVFELLPAAGGTWTEKLIYSFGSGMDGVQPLAGVTLDASGNLFGTTLGGGYGYGTVYELNPVSGGTWNEKVVHSFDRDGVDGAYPDDPVILDASDNLYGTTWNGGAAPNYLGTVFELSRSASGEWTEQVLHTFTGDADGTAPVPDGDFPYGGLVFDAAGNLYGATSGGGTAGNGAVFAMMPGPGGWTEKLLYSFGYSLDDGHAPAAALGFDAAGNLYGTATTGGTHSAGQYGAVFEIAGVTAATPKFSPAPGAYSAAQAVTISDATSGATIYYTLNGGTSPVKYTAPITVPASTIITAYATTLTLPRSQPASAGYQIGTTSATPIFTPAAGTYTLAQSITIADADPHAIIYYTTNGTTPTTSSAKYTAPIKVTTSETIEALATATGLTNSAVASATYTITPITPPKQVVLYDFAATTTDGAVPSAGVIFDSAGNLYGTTTDGGTNGKGTVYELSPVTGGGWTKTILYNFGKTTSDAAAPNAALVFGKGNLYGTTAQGGTIGMGTVFELSPAQGGGWTETILWNFGLSTTDGEVPEAGLVFDSKGNLYGTTNQGGANTTWAAGSGGWGTVFELSPPVSGSVWTEKILYAFGYLSQTDGYFPTAGVIFDSAGNLYGTTSDGGAGQDLEGGGTVFELSPTTSGPWKETVLYSFGGGSPNGYSPEGGLVMDATGNLYGTAHSGGNGFGLDGTVFEISPATGGGWTETVLHSFGAYETDGINPTSTLLLDADGNLYGTTYAGGANQVGMVYELTHEAGGSWWEQPLYNFGASATDAAHPYAGLIFDGAGRLYGTTEYGGTHGSGSTGGTVFEIETSASVSTNPTVTLTPASLTFAGTAVGASTAAQVVTLKNSSATATLTINSGGITLTGTNPGSFTKTTTCGTSLAAGASCTISVVLKPATTGALSAKLSVADNATGSPQTVSLTGTGLPAPTVTLTPTSLTFASTAVGSSTAAQVVTLKNTSTTTALTINSGGITFTGGDPGSFTKTTNCGTTLAIGASCTISVAFKPAASGSLTASLSVADDATGSPQTVSLTGTGAAAPVITLSATSLSFPNTPAGATSNDQVVTLTNTGSASANLSSITLAGTNPADFKQLHTCGATLAAGASCSVFVAFKPASAAAFSAVLSIADNASGSPQKVTLTGTGVADPTITLSAATLAFPATTHGTTSAAMALTVTNAGATTASISSVSISGANPASFSQLNNCSAPLAPAATCTAAVAFTPATAGALTATLNVAGPGFTKAVTLTGTGN
jgi:uncharacterized repeat protein (TIGR03803 family)